jgi:hypothetical protein
MPIDGPKFTKPIDLKSINPNGIIKISNKELLEMAA